LKNEYDYIIIDTAPIGLVSDAFSLMDIVDTCLYVIRQRKSLKKQLNYVDDLYSNKQLKNVGLVFNDVKVGGRYGYYGHNYGYGYGVGGAAQYNYNYGYGYGLRKTKGYGEIFESNTIWEKFLKAIKNPFNSNNNNKKG
jgi:Mrp family chromosome partitioning ATPase